MDWVRLGAGLGVFSSGLILMQHLFCPNTISLYRAYYKSFTTFYTGEQEITENAVQYEDGIFWPKVLEVSSYFMAACHENCWCFIGHRGVWVPCRVTHWACGQWGVLGKEFLCSGLPWTTDMLHNGVCLSLQLLPWHSALQLAWYFSPGLSFCFAQHEWDRTHCESLVLGIDPSPEQTAVGPATAQMIQGGWTEKQNFGTVL